MHTTDNTGLKISDYRLHRLRLPLAVPIGDSQVEFNVHWLTVLELTTANGLTGVGFELQQGKPTPALAQLESQFEYNMWPLLKGSNPFSEALRITRPRGGMVNGLRQSLHL